MENNEYLNAFLACWFEIGVLVQIFLFYRFGIWLKNTIFAIINLIKKKKLENSHEPEDEDIGRTE